MLFQAASCVSLRCRNPAPGGRAQLSRPGWMGPWAPWAVGGSPAHGRGWHWVIFKVTSNPSHSVILCCFQLFAVLSYLLLPCASDSTPHPQHLNLINFCCIIQKVAQVMSATWKELRSQGAPEQGQPGSSLSCVPTELIAVHREFAENLWNTSLFCASRWGIMNLN